MEDKGLLIVDVSVSNGQQTQNTVSNSESNIVLGKEKREHLKKKVEELWHSFVNACRWSQFKRNLTWSYIQVILNQYCYRIIFSGFALFVYSNMSINFQPTDSYLDREQVQYAQIGLIQQELKPTYQKLNLDELHSGAFVSVVHKKAYIERFKKVAQTEMQKYGIPASLTLALAAVQSDFGQSNLVQKGNNHFHLNLDANSLFSGIVGEVTIDEETYVMYQNAWTSFRAHSLYLSGERFQVLYELKSKNPLQWLKGLESLGYFTDLSMIKEVKACIDEYQLYKYDQVEA